MDPEISVNSSTMKQATAVPRFALVRPGESRERRLSACGFCSRLCTMGFLCFECLE